MKIPNVTTSAFGDYLSNKIGSDGRQTDRQIHRQTDRQAGKQTETGDLFLRTPGVIKGRENVKVERRPTASITIHISFA